MKPIECPECHSDDWEYLCAFNKGEVGDRITETMAVIREESDIQTDFKIVKVRCKECRFDYWMEQVQAECVIEEFM